MSASALKNFVREAASSSASGSRSSRAQIARIVSRFSGVIANPGFASAARSANSVSASSSLSTGTGYSCSPYTRRTSRLLARHRRRGAARRRSPTSGAAGVTCSKLSRTRSVARSRSRSRSTSVTGRDGSSGIASASAIAVGTRAGSRIGSRGTKKTPCGNSGATSLATRRERRVFPVPPGPVSVTRRWARTRAPTSCTSRSRPTKFVVSAGRLLGISSEASAGKSPASPGACTCQRCRLPTSLRRCSPRSRTEIPSPGSRNSVFVWSEITICPPLAAPAIRAARCTSMPT